MSNLQDRLDELEPIVLPRRSCVPWPAWLIALPLAAVILLAQVFPTVAGSCRAILGLLP